MIQPDRKLARSYRSTGRVLLGLWFGVAIAGCVGSRAKPLGMQSLPGAATGGIHLPDFDATPAATAHHERKFRCIVTGRGRAPDTGRADDQRRAGMQAAIVDALHHALAASGVLEPGTNGIRTVTLSPRLTLESTPDGSRILLRFDDRGRTHRIEVVEGRLTHLPLRSSLIARFLTEINDRVRLVSTEAATEPGQWVATVACYEKAVTTSRPVTASQPTTTQSAA